MYLGHNTARWFQPPTLFSQPEAAACTACLYAKLCDGQWSNSQMAARGLSETWCRGSHVRGHHQDLRDTLGHVSSSLLLLCVSVCLWAYEKKKGGCGRVYARGIRLKLCSIYQDSCKHSQCEKMKNRFKDLHEVLHRRTQTHRHTTKNAKRPDIKKKRKKERRKFCTVFFSCLVTSLLEKLSSPINIRWPRGEWSCVSETQIWSGLSSMCRRARQKSWKSFSSEISESVTVIR